MQESFKVGQKVLVIEPGQHPCLLDAFQRNRELTIISVEVYGEYPDFDMLAVDCCLTQNYWHAKRFKISDKKEEESMKTNAEAKYAPAELLSVTLELSPEDAKVLCAIVGSSRGLQDTLVVEAEDYRPLAAELGISTRYPTDTCDRIYKALSSVVRK